eukprot:TRINITY_DN109100_c0_g1_i1.p2 TRINITY_DN109100_c0_g1~~TRINITY_DN109100_c0_g1_i1.p2  ORF type:complete len:130 (-),score=9.17 TRINITY_DN109100_c0_g1_i1:60-449(-)
MNDDRPSWRRVVNVNFRPPRGRALVHVNFRPPRWRALLHVHCRPPPRTRLGTTIMAMSLCEKLGVNPLAPLEILAAMIMPFCLEMFLLGSSRRPIGTDWNRRQRCEKKEDNGRRAQTTSHGLNPAACTK